MRAEWFLDTNVLVYTFDASAPRKRRRAQELVAEALEGRGVTSWQIVQEFVNVALHRFEKPLTVAQLSDYTTEILTPLCQVWPSADLYRAALAIHAETGYRFYDALVVASAVASGARILYTEDLQAGRRIHGVTLQDPFQ